MLPFWGRWRAMGVMWQEAERLALGEESKQTPLLIPLFPYIHSEDTTQQYLVYTGKKKTKKQVRLSTSYRYYRATYQTIV